MLKSMTGFGRYELINGQSKIMVEMKSVNHRYLDLSIKMPKKFNCFEAAIRNLIKNNVQRGKIDVLTASRDLLSSSDDSSSSLKATTRWQQLSRQYRHHRICCGVQRMPWTPIVCIQWH